jgi:DNA modification methylase
MFSFVGDTVLDPFWGTGSTTAAAMDAHRSSIGYEIEPAFLEIGRERFRQMALDAPVDFVVADDNDLAARESTLVAAGGE